MLADSFADMKTGRRIAEKISEKNPSLSEKLTKKYSAESVKNLIQKLSQLGRKNKNYVEKFYRKCERMVGVVLES